MTLAIVSGAIANKPFSGGEAWVRLSWVLGLRRLGLDVHFVEQLSPESCIDEKGDPTPFERAANRRYFESVVAEFGLAGSATLVCGDGEATVGLAWPELVDLAGEAALLVNISGHLELEPLLERIPHKAYVDLDPGFTQIWHAAGTPGSRLEGHDHYFTVGENVGTARSSVPTGGIDWRPLPPPVVLDEWPACGAPSQGVRFTTIATWRGPFGPLEHEGRTLGLKVHEFRKVIALPTRVAAPFEIALDIHPADQKDRRALEENGWSITDPRAEVPHPRSFRRYVQTSGAEFSVAQGVYTETNTGWFSDRTVRYLASGRPALIQETGFSDNYPTGEGLLSFRTLEDAVAGAETITRDYDAHSRAARVIAERYFDSDLVLKRFLEAVGVAL